MEVLTILATGTLCIVCFYFGVRVGQKTSKGETIELPSLDPMKPIRERQERNKIKEEQSRFDAIMRNIDNYDGTGNYQEDVPR